MNDEARKASEELEASAFGRVLAGIMRSRGMAVDTGTVEWLADGAGLVPEDLQARMAGETTERVGSLEGLRDALKLNGDEEMKLALAYTLEREPATEREKDSVYLTEVMGVSEEEAERILEDADLFLTNPGSRYAFEPEEAVQVWTEAQERLRHIAEAQSAGDIFGENLGVEMLLWDAASRARELLERSRGRVT